MELWWAWEVTKAIIIRHKHSTSNRRQRELLHKQLIQTREEVCGFDDACGIAEARTVHNVQ